MAAAISPDHLPFKTGSHISWAAPGAPVISHMQGAGSEKTQRTLIMETAAQKKAARFISRLIVHAISACASMPPKTTLSHNPPCCPARGGLTWGCLE